MFHLNWLMLPYDVIFKQFDYLDLKDLEELLLLNNTKLNDTIFHYIEQKLLARKYDYSDILYIKEINADFTKLIDKHFPLNYEKYHEYILSDPVDFSGRGSIKYLYINNRCKKLNRFIHEMCDHFEHYRFATRGLSLHLGELTYRSNIKIVENFSNGREANKCLDITINKIEIDITDTQIEQINNFIRKYEHLNVLIERFFDEMFIGNIIDNEISFIKNYIEYYGINDIDAELNELRQLYGERFNEDILN
jgi:hypothetical protein